MTLNITILTPRAIYQSADYRLSDARTARPFQAPSTKGLILTYMGWTGFITYAGIGRVGVKHTSDFVREWLANVETGHFASVVEAIRRRASGWLRSVAKGQRHTFLVAGFVDGIATAAIISNFQRWHGADLPTVVDSFVTSIVKVTRRPQIIVTGVTHAVHRLERRRLQQLSETHSADPARIRRAIATTNRTAAARSPKLISADCLVYSQDSGGRGQEEVFGNSRTEVTSLMPNGGASQVLKSFLDQYFGADRWSMRAATFMRSSTQSEMPSLCQITIDCESVRSEYKLIALENAADRRATPRSINASGIVVGEATPSWQGPSYPCSWSKLSELEFLSHGGGLGGSARGIDDLGIIVGNTEGLDRALCGCIWDPQRQRTDIGYLLGRHSGVTRITPHGCMVGWVSVHPTDGGQTHFRPVYWSKDGTPIVLHDLEGAWGEGIDANSGGLVLIRVHMHHHASARLWDGRKTYEIGKPDPSCVAFWPKQLLENDSVIGLAIMEDGRRGASIWTKNNQWTFLAQPAHNREITATNALKAIVGYDIINDYQVPWVSRGGADTLYLPHLRYHHHRPNMISQQGLIVGTASSDNCCHPIVWLPA